MKPASDLERRTPAPVPTAAAFGRAPRTAALLAVSALTLALPVAAQDVPAAPGTITGIWQGDLHVSPVVSLTIVFHLEVDDQGAISATMDSPDQGATGIPVQSARFEDGRLVLELPALMASFEGSLSPDGTLVGEWRQSGQAFPLELRKVDAVATPARPQEPEPPFPYTEEEVRYLSPEAGIHLAGTLTLPEGEGPFPAVALITGSGPQDRDETLLGHRPFLVLADHLTRHGIAVLRSDDRGVAGSEGDFASATSMDFADDAAAAVAYLGTRPEVEPAAIGLVGHSEGGLIAPIVAARSDDVAFIVLLAGPGLTGEEILYLQAELILRASGASEIVIDGNRAIQRAMFRVAKEEDDPERRVARARDVLRETLAGIPSSQLEMMGVPSGGEEAWIEAQAGQLSSEWMRFFLVHDPVPLLREVRVPVLALNGELDLQVPPAENLEAIAKALEEGGNPDVTTVMLPGLNHLFQTATTGAPSEYARIDETFAPAALEAVAEWILDRFGSR